MDFCPFFLPEVLDVLQFLVVPQNSVFVPIFQEPDVSFFKTVDFGFLSLIFQRLAGKQVDLLSRLSPQLNNNNIGIIIFIYLLSSIYPPLRMMAILRLKNIRFAYNYLYYRQNIDVVLLCSYFKLINIFG